MTASSFLPYAQRIMALLQQTGEALARDVDSGTYPGEEDNLEMELAALDHIPVASAARGIDAALPDLILDLVSKQIAAGHDRDGFSRVIEGLRLRTSAA